MPRDDPPKTRPEGRRPTVLGAELVTPEAQRQHPGAERTDPPPKRSESPFPEQRLPPVRIEVEEAVQSMRPRATHAVAKLLALPAVVAGLIALLYAGSGWLDSDAKRKAAETKLFEAQAAELPKLGQEVKDLAARVKALEGSVDQRELKQIRDDLDAAKRKQEAQERDITKLYRARPTRAPED